MGKSRCRKSQAGLTIRAKVQDEHETGVLEELPDERGAQNDQK